MLSSGLASCDSAQAYLHLDVLGVLRGRAHGHRDVVGHLVAGDRDHRRVANGALREHREVRGAAADVDDADAELALIVGEAGETRRELLEHDVVDLEPAALDALLEIVGGALRAGDDVHLGFEAHARHADGIADAFLAVDDEFLRQHVQDLLVRRNGHGLGRVHHVLHVDVAHFAIADRDHAVRIQAAHVQPAMPANTERISQPAMSSASSIGALDRLHRRLDVDHHAFLQAARGLRADADHFDRVVGRHFADQRGHLRGADVEADDEILVGRLPLNRAIK